MQPSGVGRLPLVVSLPLFNHCENPGELQMETRRAIAHTGTDGENPDRRDRRHDDHAMGPSQPTGPDSESGGAQEQW